MIEELCYEGPFIHFCKNCYTLFLHSRALFSMLYFSRSWKGCPPYPIFLV